MAVGDIIEVHDKLQAGYVYALEASMGKVFAANFKPQHTPPEMLAMGVFEGKYINDCEAEFPADWYKGAARLPCAPGPGRLLKIERKALT